MNQIKNILKVHIEWILIVVGILFATVIGWILIWGITVLAGNLGASLATPRDQYAGERFNLDGASSLNFRGLK